MRSPLEICALALTAVALASALPLLAQQTGRERPSAPAVPAPPSVGVAAPTETEIDAALAKVAADPNLASVRTLRTLKWDGGSTRRSPPSWLAWAAGLFRWIAETGRILVWVALLLLAALLVIYLVRLVRSRGAAGASGRFVAPSHVQDLDIRPESLPEDIGAAARGLWDGGERRAALALLYRGTLSRLVHVHAVPIRDSSTEGDCLALASPRLGDERNGFVRRLVRVWQLAVYGGEDPSAAEVYSLCAGFRPALDAGVEPRSVETAARAPA